MTVFVRDTDLDGFCGQLVARAREAIRNGSLCRLPLSMPVMGAFDVWSPGIDVYSHDGIEHWAVSMSRVSGTPSISAHRLVKTIVVATGYPEDAPDVQPVVSVKEAAPHAVLWWTWHSDGSPLSHEAKARIEDIVSSITPRRSAP